MDFSPVFEALEQCETSISDTELLSRAGDLVYALLNHKKTSPEAPKRASEALHLVYVAEIDHLVDIKSDWHFLALRAIPQDLDGFHMEELADDICLKAPMLSALLDVLLCARKRPRQCSSRSEASSAASATATNNPDDDEILLEGQMPAPIVASFGCPLEKSCCDKYLDAK